MCELATKLPLLIGGLLDREKLLKRGRFREETMTDIFAGALAAFAGPDLVIQYPVELVTGGDMDLRFWHAESGRSLSVRIQAKRLNGEKLGAKSIKIKHRAYDELLHKSPTARDYQFRVLCKAPDPWVPLYMFYNHDSVTRDATMTAATPTVKGINLAFADDVARELEEKLASAKAKPKKIRHHKRLSHLRKHFFDLEALLCGGAISIGERVPRPETVQGALRREYRLIGEREKGREDADFFQRYLAEPNGLVGRDIPHLLDGRSIRVGDDNVNVPTITFISGRTKDGRSPTISD